MQSREIAVWFSAYMLADLSIDFVIFRFAAYKAGCEVVICSIDIIAYSPLIVFISFSWNFNTH